MNLYHFVRNTLPKDGLITVHLVTAPTLKRAEELYAGKTQMGETAYAEHYEAGEIKVDQIYSNIHATIEQVRLLYEKYFTTQNILK